MEVMMKEEITNIIRTFEAVGPILGNALKSGQLFKWEFNSWSVYVAGGRVF